MSTRSCSPIARRGTGSRQLVKRRRRLTGAEVDELVELYQRVSTHLSMVRTASTRFGAGGPVVVAGGSGPFGGHRCACAAVERVRPVLDGVVSGRRLPVVAVVGSPRPWRSSSSRWSSRCGWQATRRCRQRSEHPREIDQLVNHDVADYYSEHPAGSFALQVWTNNSWVAAQCIAFALLLGIPDPVRPVSERRQSRRSLPA